MAYSTERLCDAECRVCGSLIFFYVRPVADWGTEEDAGRRDDWMAARMPIVEYEGALCLEDMAAACYCAVTQDQVFEQCKTMAGLMTAAWREHRRHCTEPLEHEFELVSFPDLI